MLDVGKKNDKSTLFKIRKFYNVFSDEKVSTLLTQLSWSHYADLLPIKDMRLPEGTKYKLICKEEPDIVDIACEYDLV